MMPLLARGHTRHARGPPVRNLQLLMAPVNYLSNSPQFMFVLFTINVQNDVDRIVTEQNTQLKFVSRLICISDSYESIYLKTCYDPKKIIMVNDRH